MGKRLAFITGRALRAAGMHKGKDSSARGSGYCVDIAPLPPRRVIPTGRPSDDELPSRIIEAVE